MNKYNSFPFNLLLIDILVIVLALLVLSQCLQAQQTNDQANRRAAIVRVRVGSSSGSGTLVDYDQVLTAAHMFRGERTTNATVMFGRQAVGGRLASYDGTYDQALIQLDRRVSIEPIPIAPANAAVGEALVVCGYASGRLQFKPGRKMQNVMPKLGARPDWIEIAGGAAGAARSGDSGGPILNARGELVGITHSTTGHSSIGVGCGRTRLFCLPRLRLAVRALLTPPVT
jgi:S1-C subfamily serine protease